MLAVADQHPYRPLPLSTGHQVRFPVTLKFRSLFYDCDEEGEMSIKLTSQLAFDFWTCKEAESLLSERLRIQNPFMWQVGGPPRLSENHGKATLWLKRENDLNSFIPVNQLHVKQLHSLAEAVQAHKKATATGTYLFMEHPVDLTGQMSDGTRCHWTEGSSKEGLDHRVHWNNGYDYPSMRHEAYKEVMPPGPSYRQ